MTAIPASVCPKTTPRGFPCAKTLAHAGNCSRKRRPNGSVPRYTDADHKTSYQELKEKLEAAVAFKKYVHDRLDAAGVPVSFDDEHAKAGCRVGGRLDYIINRSATAVKEREELQRKYNRQADYGGILEWAEPVVETVRVLLDSDNWVGDQITQKANLREALEAYDKARKDGGLDG